MGNAAGKGSEALKDAVQTMLEVPLTGTNSAASSEFAGGQGQQDGEGNDEDQEEEEDEIWQSVFGCDLEEGEFYEVHHVYSGCDPTYECLMLLNAGRNVWSV